MCVCIRSPVYSVMSKSMSLRQFFDASQRPVASCLRTKQEWRGETLRSVTDSLVDPKELAEISSLEYRNTSNFPMLLIHCCFVFVLVLMRKIQLWFRLIKGLSKWLIKKKDFHNFRTLKWKMYCTKAKWLNYCFRY